MKTLGTIALSPIAIVASLVFVLSTLCAFHGDFMGQRSPSYSICSVAPLSIVIGAMWVIGRLHKKH
jgi:hypothetical protein